MWCSLWSLRYASIKAAQQTNYVSRRQTINVIDGNDDELDMGVCWDNMTSSTDHQARHVNLWVRHSSRHLSRYDCILISRTCDQLQLQLDMSKILPAELTFVRLTSLVENAIACTRGRAKSCRWWPSLQNQHITLSTWTSRPTNNYCVFCSQCAITSLLSSIHSIQLEQFSPIGSSNISTDQITSNMLWSSSVYLTCRDLCCHLDEVIME